MTSPKQYITKPSFVEAWQIHPDSIEGIADWCNGRVRGSTVIFPKIRHRGKPLQPHSKDNNHYALISDYVVKVSSGFVRMSEEEFLARYAETNGARLKT